MSELTYTGSRENSIERKIAELNNYKFSFDSYPQHEDPILDDFDFLLSHCPDKIRVDASRSIKNYGLRWDFFEHFFKQIVYSVTEQMQPYFNNKILNMRETLPGDFNPSNDHILYQILEKKFKEFTDGYQIINFKDKA